jgi:hypothetical protein
MRTVPDTQVVEKPIVITETMNTVAGLGDIAGQINMSGYILKYQTHVITYQHPRSILICLP